MSPKKPNKKGRRFSSISKKNKLKFHKPQTRKRFSSQPKKLKHPFKYSKPKPKNFKKKNTYIKLETKNFTSKLLQWYMSKRLINYREAVDLSIPDHDINVFSQSIFSKRFQNSKIVLIDCRYEYEFLGGHVKGAMNIIDPAVIKELFFGHNWIGSRRFMEFVLGYGGRRVDMDLAREILRKYEKQEIIECSDSINGKMQKMKDMEFPK
jgi:hypothetical protein